MPTLVMTRTVEDMSVGKILENAASAFFAPLRATLGDHLVQSPSYSTQTSLSGAPGTKMLATIVGTGNHLLPTKHIEKAVYSTARDLKDASWYRLQNIVKREREQDEDEKNVR
ncbi:unnamed protein product [Penicillium pancosmium]